MMMMKARLRPTVHATAKHKRSARAMLLAALKAASNVAAQRQNRACGITLMPVLGLARDKPNMRAATHFLTLLQQQQAWSTYCRHCCCLSKGRRTTLRDLRGPTTTLNNSNKGSITKLTSSQAPCTSSKKCDRTATRTSFFLAKTGSSGPETSFSNSSTAKSDLTTRTKPPRSCQKLVAVSDVHGERSTPQAAAARGRGSKEVIHLRHTNAGEVEERRAARYTEGTKVRKWPSQKSTSMSPLSNEIAKQNRHRT